ncbi:DUF5615 family PIN-like protein [Brevundimonas sp.]|uniref:DUF5615 family PIN-like protein n=1 Tax=Brevundimonas sp. TaxID=1871086 RepID=UPI001A1EC8D3|nr:DUF5615 family PIN-like protein [Brevundimonas sp.]MBJ7486696.1 DUF5615 family PIN-like protein [Brevundimonas sp.]
MRFLIDQNLPTRLIAVLEAMGHPADHIKLRGLAEAADDVLWQLAIDEDRVMVSKDSDFVTLAQRGESGAVLRLAVGNCPNTLLYDLVREKLPAAILRLSNGERLVEIER